MSTYWLKNFLGLRCSDFEMLKVPNPRLEYTIQVTFKTTQLCALAGTLSGGFVHFIRFGARGTSLEAFQSAAASGATVGLLSGLVAGPILAGIRLADMRHVELFDTCYRIRFNRRQLNVNRATILGALVGAGLSGGVGGLALGVDAGYLLGHAYHFVTRK